ncbi:MAG: DNA helicase RecQ [Oscillospiraceae bacterium]
MQNKYEILKTYFGYDEFRDGQEELIDAILAHRDVLGVMPTGAGKSMCYEVPAMLLCGITLVISPLISLMKDQVNSLTQSGIKAAYLNSSLTKKQYNYALECAARGEYKIIYVAPERLMQEDFLYFAQNADISMLTVDEAHCISQWGQDFRTSYTRITDFISLLNKRPIISAFTATATREVRDDILLSLNIQDAKVLVSGFDRKNLYFEVQKPRDKSAALLSYLKDKLDATGIVYCSTRKAVEEVCDTLIDAGFSATRYHAGLTEAERHANQDAFTFDKANIIVATNAFGMGIDKSNVSFVIHYNMPKDIESYYQEAGRAGRDGEKADCILLYSGQDVRTNTFLIEHGQGKEYENEETKAILQARDRDRLKVMTFYCATSTCLREYILRYFGERAPAYCGNCSSCLSNAENIDITIVSQKILSCVYKAHERYGAAVITDILRGTKSLRLTQHGLDKLSTYGICTESAAMLRDIINYLVMHDYLCTTNDEYPVIKLGSKAREILHERRELHMRICKHNDGKAQRSSAPVSAEQRINTKLLAQLKALRLSLATKQSVPAYVIFTDSTLADMSMKKPVTNADFLKVSGIGIKKLERYGADFIEVIRKFTNDNTDIAEPFVEPLSFSDVEISQQPLTVSGVAENINYVLMQKHIKSISATHLNKWLIQNDYLYEDELKIKRPTAKGETLGITLVLREIRGTELSICYYSANAQQGIIDKLNAILP